MKYGWVNVNGSEKPRRDREASRAPGTDRRGFPGFSARRRIIVGSIGSILWLLMLCCVRAAEPKRFMVIIKGGHVAKGKRTLRVTEGDRVEIEFTSDRTLTLHLHGIDIELIVDPGIPAVMRFGATIAGRFPVEAHGTGGHGSLIYIEVHPR